MIEREFGSEMPATYQIWKKTVNGGGGGGLTVSKRQQQQGGTRSPII